MGELSRFVEYEHPSTAHGYLRSRKTGFWETSIPDLHLEAGHQRLALVILRLLSAMLPSRMNSWPYIDHTTTKNACRALNYRCWMCTRG